MKSRVLKVLKVLKAVDYGIGMKGRYRVMGDAAVATFFIEQGWKPPYTREERELEISRRMQELEFSREEAEWDIDEEIQKNLEQFVALAFAKTSSLM